MGNWTGVFMGCTLTLLFCKFYNYVGTFVQVTNWMLSQVSVNDNQTTIHSQELFYGGVLEGVV